MRKQHSFFLGHSDNFKVPYFRGLTSSRTAGVRVLKTHFQKKSGFPKNVFYRYLRLFRIQQIVNPNPERNLRLRDEIPESADYSRLNCNSKRYSFITEERLSAATQRDSLQTTLR